MTTNELLELDCRKDENRKKIQRALKIIKPLSRIEGEVPVEKLERAIKVMCEKYHIYLRELTPDTSSGDQCIVWRATVFEGRTLDTLGIAHGCTVYECLAKVAILVYDIVRRKE